jgi:hypothetical protein
MKAETHNLFADGSFFYWGIAVGFSQLFSKHNYKKALATFSCFLLNWKWS